VGLQDRDYIRDRRASGYRGGGFGAGVPMGIRTSPSRWGFNTWLIIINVAVFVLMVALQNITVHVWQGDSIRPDIDNLAQRELAVVDDQEAWRAVRGPRGGVAAIEKPLVDTTTQPPTVVGARRYYAMDPITAFGHFSTARAFVWFPPLGGPSLGLEVWRLVSFQFLHAGIGHLFFNMLGLFFFGRPVEEYLGTKRYASFYFACGVCGGLAYLLLNFVGMFGLPLPGALNVYPTTPLVGASAGVFGVILASAYIMPNAVVQLLLPPIPIKMTWFAYGYVAIAAFNLFIGRGPNQGGDAAHVGGAIAGFFFIRRPHVLREFLDVFGKSSKTQRKPPPRRSGRSEDREIDRILEKVHRDGINSLSDKERKKLQRASGAD